MKAVIAIVGLGSAALLLYVGARVMDGTLDVWDAIRTGPRQFVNYVSTSFSHDMIWTAVVVIGVVAAIAIVRRAPVEKIR